MSTSTTTSLPFNPNIFFIQCYKKFWKVNTLREWKKEGMSTWRPYLLSRFYYQWYLFSGIELYVRCDRWVIAPNTPHNLFQYDFLCPLTLITRKLQVVYGRSTYRMTVLLSRMSIFCVRDDARYNWQVIAPNTHCSVLPMSHLCLLTFITWKLLVIYGCSAYWTTALLLKTFFVWY